MRIIYLIILCVFTSQLVWSQTPGTTKIKSTIPSEGPSLQKAKSNSTHHLDDLSPAQQQLALQRAEIKEKRLKTAAIYQKYLGVSSPKDPQYAAKKEALFKNNPEAYQQMKQELQDAQKPKQPQIIYRSKYEQMSDEAKQKIDANPDWYKIID